MNSDRNQTGLATMATLLFGGIGLGAGLMYLLDPDRGARRRHMTRDKATHLLHEQGRVLEKGTRDLGNRAAGLVARIRSALRMDADLSDEKLAARVHTAIGRCVAHPSSIEVVVQDGKATLSGPIFADEVDELIRRVRRVRGIREVENRLDPHHTADGVPGLQGEPKQRRRPMLLRESWPPSLRLVIGSLSLATGACGLARKDACGRLLAGASAVTLARAMLDMPVKRMVGIGASRRAIDLHKTITIHAPVEEVFQFWSRFENFPQFMAHVRDIRVSDDRRHSHWKVEGPGGTTFAWEAETTVSEPNQRLAWKTLPGASVQHAGIIRFESVEPDKTRLDIRMSYNPPAGAVGHAVAKLFHKDAKTSMDEDMVRLKSLLEGRGAPRETERAPEVELH